MKNLLFTQKKQLNIGAIVSGLGLLAGLVWALVRLPPLGGKLILAVSIAIAGWTLLSMLLYPKDRRAEDVSFNALWGQAALMLLLVLLFI